MGGGNEDRGIENHSHGIGVVVSGEARCGKFIAKGARDATAATIRDLATRLPRKMDGDLAPEDPFQDDLRDIRVIDMTGLDSIQARGQRALSLWKKYNLRLLAGALPALLVGARPPRRWRQRWGSCRC